MWCDVIKCGGSALYSVCDMIHIVGVMSYIQRVYYRWKSGCDDTHSVAVTSYTMDMMSSYLADEISKIQLVWYYQDSGCDDTGTVYTMSNIVGVVSLKWWLDVINRGCYVLYSGKNATHMASVMPYRLCVMWSIEWEWWHQLVAVMSHV